MTRYKPYKRKSKKRNNQRGKRFMERKQSKKRLNKIQLHYRKKKQNFSSFEKLHNIIQPSEDDFGTIDPEKLVTELNDWTEKFKDFIVNEEDFRSFVINVMEKAFPKSIKNIQIEGECKKKDGKGEGYFDICYESGTSQFLLELKTIMKGDICLDTEEYKFDELINAHLTPTCAFSYLSKKKWDNCLDVRDLVESAYNQACNYDTGNPNVIPYCFVWIDGVILTSACLSFPISFNDFCEIQSEIDSE